MRPMRRRPVLHWLIWATVLVGLAVLSHIDLMDAIAMYGGD
jgi:hypothetical protein